MKSDSKNKSINQKDLVLAISQIYTLLEAHRFEDVNQLLKEHKEQDTAIEHSIGILRSSFPARSLLREWSGLLDRVNKEIKRCGLEQNLLSGLE